MKIALDFDGVICSHEGINRNHNFADNKPVKDALDAIEGLIRERNEIWIFTSRPQSEWDDIREWLKKWNFPELLITDTKTEATIYLDDRAIRFTNWQDFCKLLK